MHLTLFVPDLLWPDIDDPSAFEFTGAAQLARLLSLAQPSNEPLSPTASWESCLAQCFGFDEIPLPLAALRKRGEIAEQHIPATNTGPLLCADPVSLDFIQQALTLSPIAASRISADDCQALLSSLNAEFAQEGQFIAAPPGDLDAHWYFVPRAEIASTLPNLAPCSRLAGRRIDADTTRELLGREGLGWLNRIQMCLNEHPVNQAREAAGLNPINSLWPWGFGQLTNTPGQRFAQASGASALLNGLCQITDTPLTPRSRFELIPGQHLVVDLTLTEAIRSNALDHWQSSCSRLIADWLDPALCALRTRQGGLQTLTLISPNAHDCRTWTIDRDTKGLRGTLLQRSLGLKPKAISLATLVRSWST